MNSTTNTPNTVDMIRAALMDDYTLVAYTRVDVDRDEFVVAVTDPVAGMRVGVVDCDAGTFEPRRTGLAHKRAAVDGAMHDVLAEVRA